MKAGKLKCSLGCWIILEVRTNIDARYKIGQTSLHGPAREGRKLRSHRSRGGVVSKD
jgi:hypothetical protein